MLYFLRDDSNNLLGFTYQGDTYYYKKNAFDDIIGIYDSNYKEVCTYNYDAYGNILSIKDSTGKDITDTSNVAIINPFRYRSYYYDTETNLYYLNSRYYSPKMGRFINCDGILIKTGNILSLNAYCYCLNNPVNRIDSGGRSSNPFSKLGEYYEKAKKSVSNAVNGAINTVSNGFDWIKRKIGVKTTYTTSQEVMKFGGIKPFLGGVTGGVNENFQTGNLNIPQPNSINIDITESGLSIGFNAISVGIDVSDGLAVSASASLGSDIGLSISKGITFDLRKETKMTLTLPKKVFGKESDVMESSLDFYGTISEGIIGMLLPGINAIGGLDNYILPILIKS